jgi:hypothetical protein
MNFSEQEWKAAQSQMADADPEQLKAQARMMKNMDKNTVRRMNPQFANMSDQELDMMATQMEMMASNCVEINQCVRRRVDGVEDDVMNAP